MKKLKSLLFFICFSIVVAGACFIAQSCCGKWGEKGGGMLCAEAKAKRKDALKAYKKLLAGNKVTIDGCTHEIPNGTKFTVNDVTGDGIPELFLDTDFNLSESIVGIVYTYYNEKLKYISKSDHGKITVYRKGTIFLKEHLNRGYLTEEWAQIVQGKEKIVAKLTDDSGGNPDDAIGIQYYVKGEKTTEKRYQKFIKKLTKNSKSISDSDWHILTAANISKYLK